MRAVSPDRIRLFSTYFWDDMYISAGRFRLQIELNAGISAQDMLFSYLGELMAMHDAVVLAMREKRKHDLARPESIIKYVEKYLRTKLAWSQ